MTPRYAAGVLAGLLLIVGLFLGVSSVSIGRDVSCGTAFRADAGSATIVEIYVGHYVPLDQPEIRAPISAAVMGKTYVAQCSDARGARRTICLVLIGVGVLAGLYLGLTNTSDA